MKDEIAKKILKIENDKLMSKSEPDRDWELITALEERPQDKWIKISPAKIYECSECRLNLMTSNIKHYLYCHHCGAKMETTEKTVIEHDSDEGYECLIAVNDDGGIQ